MKKMIIIALTCVCFLLTTAAPGFSKPRSTDKRQGIAKKNRTSGEKVKSASGAKRSKTAHKKGHKNSRMAKNSRANETFSEVRETDGEFVEYKVVKGDTVETVAAKFSVEKEDILASNANMGRRLSPGRVLLIPKTEDENATEEIVDLPTRTLTPWKTNEERYMLVKVAKSFMGAPYRYGGESVRGLDCSAYVKKIYSIFDVDLPRIARDQYASCPKVSKEELSVGDLVFFKTKRYAKYPTHVGIYIGEGNFIHSSSAHGRIGVKVDSLRTDFYNRTYIGATRVKKPSDEGASGTPEAPAQQSSGLSQENSSL